MRITQPMEEFVRHWGAMGQRWGVNRSVAQIHALLYLADDPVPAEDIADILDMARSNVSTSLKELMAFQLVELVHVDHDRRDHFRAKQDPFDMVIAIVEERKKREIDPARRMVHACLDAAAQDKQTPNGARARLAAMAELLDQLDSLYASMRRLSKPALKRVVKMGDRLAKIL